ncbi:5144_t:CDS:2, partial [Scutellospora calospora]
CVITTSFKLSSINIEPNFQAEQISCSLVWHVIYVDTALDIKMPWYQLGHYLKQDLYDRCPKRNVMDQDNKSSNLLNLTVSNTKPLKKSKHSILQNATTDQGMTVYKGGYTLTLTQMTQISCAIKVCKELIKNLHRDGLDRGFIATFNNTMVIRQGFTKDEELLHRSLDRLINGGTRIYDSMVDSVKAFRNNGDRTHPWILIVVTDGDDTSSCANEVSRLFTNESSNFLFVLGLGDNVNSKRLEESYHFKSLSPTSLSVGNVSTSWAEIRSQRELSKLTIDYALLIDVSGSMKNKILPN